MNDISEFNNEGSHGKKTFICLVSEYWLDDGSKGLVLLSEDGNDYYVMPNKQADKLKSFIDEEIVATGNVSTDDAGDAYISIKGFETMEYDDDFGYDLDDDFGYGLDDDYEAY